MKKNTPKDYAVALYETTKDLGGSRLEKAISEFAQLVVKKGSAKQLNKIIDEYIKYTKKLEGIIDIEITSARPLSEKLVHAIKNSFGKKVETTEKVDESLIGGIRVKTKDTVFDGSLKKQLQILKQTIN
jgi:F-type H+-transporting ATPase subunit delta